MYTYENFKNFRNFKCLNVKYFVSFRGLKCNRQKVPENSNSTPFSEGCI